MLNVKFIISFFFFSCLGIGIPLLIYNIFKDILLFMVILLIRQENKSENGLAATKTDSRKMSIPEPIFVI